MSNTYLQIPIDSEVEVKVNQKLLSIIPEDTTASAREMLEKIYLACQLNPSEETATYICSPPEALASSIADADNELRVVVFGLSPKQIGALWSVSLYRWVPIQAQHWCFAERLETIEADIEKKKVLWSCLKVLKEAK